MTKTTSPGCKALRKGRISLPGQVYLLTLVTADRTLRFLDIEMARAACRLMVEPGTWGDARPLCWIFMPDHWHGLVEVGERDDLALVMNRLKSLVSKRLRQIEPGTCVWARGFHDHALRQDRDVRSAARYIIANSLRAGLVERVRDYPYWDCVWL